MKRELTHKALAQAMNKRNKIEEDNSLFDEYKDKVDYTYIIKGLAPYKLNATKADSIWHDEKGDLSWDQETDAIEEFEKEVEDLLKDEAYLKDSFEEEEGLDKVYPKLNAIDEYVEITFGITTIKDKNVAIEEIIADIKEYMKNIDSNIDGVIVSGVSGNEDPSYDTEPMYVTLKINGEIKTEILKSEDKTKIENFVNFLNENKITESVEDNTNIIQQYCDANNLVMQTQKLDDGKGELYTYDGTDSYFLGNIVYDENNNAWEYTLTIYPEKIEEPIEIDAPEAEFNNYEEINPEKIEIDKMLVNEGKVTFKKENDIKTISLNDDGIVEYYENKQRITNKPFSKSNLQKEYKQLIEEGYKIVKEVEDINNVPDNNDLEQTKQNLEQGIEKVDQLQDLKDELIDKVDTLVNESEDRTKFPSSDFTKKPLSLDDLKNLDLEHNLNQEQIDWIDKTYGSLDDVTLALRDVFALLSFIEGSEPIISLDDYLNNIND